MNKQASRAARVSLALLVAGCSGAGGALKPGLDAGGAHPGGGGGGHPGTDAGSMVDAGGKPIPDPADMSHTGGAYDAGTPPDLSMPSGLIDQLLKLTAVCTAANMVSKHTYPDPGSAVPNVPICALNGAVFFNSDMDIDCDGRATPGKCPGPDPSYQPDTAFHNLNNQPLEAAVTPYVVIPSDFQYAGLDTQNGGNVVAVIYNHKLEFAVFGDTGPVDLIGEASYSCAENLGINPNPATGGVNSGVTYIVFVGMSTAPTNIEDRTETATLGDALAKQLVANN
jgi:hypothetical protein